MALRSLLIASLIPWALSASGCCLLSAEGYRGSSARSFDGERFINSKGREREGGFLDLVKWMATRDRGAWPEPFEAEPGPPPPTRVGVGEIRVTFINHASVLIQMDGLNVLTDPIWSDVAGPFYNVGVRRVRPPGLRFEDLPPIDLVLISHNHYDHLDVPTLLRLQASHGPRIAAGLGTARYLRSRGVRRARDFEWWASERVSRQVRLHAVETRHFAMRGMCDRDNTLWTGFVLEGPSGRVLFAGDTGYGAHFLEARRRLGPMTLAVLPIGAYRPRWFMAPVHMDPKEAVQAHVDLGARHSVAIHYGTFRQADDGYDEPKVDLERALEKAGLTADDFWVLGFGEGRTLSGGAY